MKIVITAGHMSPALCVVNALPKEDEVLFIGRKHAIEGDRALSLEYSTAKSLNIPFKSITTGRLQRKFTKHTVFSLFKFPYGILQAFFILKKFKPDIILSFGAYVSLPVTIAGFFLKIPIVVHEQTLEAGLSNRIASFFAKKVCISWENSRKFFPGSKVVLTGNPVRKFSCEAGSRSAIQLSISNEDIPMIYITGGSSGSHAINVLIEGCIEKLLKDYKVFHQTGDAKEFMDFERLQKLKETFGENLKKRYIIAKFIDPLQVGAILKKADLVVSRSGINTITELISLGKMSLLIPLPYAQNKEQKKNAVFLKELGLGEVFNQYDLTSEKLYDLINLMIKNIKKYEENAVNAQKKVSKDAENKIINVLNEVVK